MQKCPSTMRAVLLKGHGGFERLDYREDVPVPRPASGEVLIRVGAAGVNNTDINTRTAWYSRAVSAGTTAEGGTAGYAEASAADAGWTGAEPMFPRIQGADACGHIVAVGDGVDPRRIGTRVLVEPVFRTPSGNALYFGSERDGAFAEFTAVPAAHAYPVVSPWSDAELASIPCAYAAAENMLVRGGLCSGERVLVTGASGNVGSAAVQLARARDAQVVAVADGAKAAAVAALGAERVLPRDADLVAVLGLEAIDLVVDVVGGPQFPRLLDVLRRGGRYAVAGAIAGPKVELDLRTLYLKDLRLIGCTVLEAQVFGTLITYIERQEIRPLVARIYPLRDIVAAQQDFLAKRHIGKIILVP